MNELSLILILLGLSVLLAVAINKYFIIKRKRKAVNKLESLPYHINCRCVYVSSIDNRVSFSKHKKVIKRKLRYIK